MLKWSNLTDHFLDILYPRICFHCHMPIESKAVLFCSTCSEDFFFSEKSLISKDQLCLSFFEPLGAVKTLQNALKKPSHLFLAKQLAYFYFIAWEKKEWPVPELVLSLKEIAFYKRDCPKKALAKKFAKLLQTRYLCSREKKLRLEEKTILLLEISINEARWEKLVELCMERGAKKIYGLCLTSS